MQRYLTQRGAPCCDCGQQDQAVVRRLLAIRKIKDYSDASYDETDPLEQAQRARELTKHQLVIEGHEQHQRQADEREDVEEAKRHGRHSVMSSLDVAW